MATRWKSEPKILFRPGYWKGKYYSVDDCKEAVVNFSIIAPSWLPAITLGHDEKQPTAHAFGLPFDPEGFPNFGRNTMMWWDDTSQAIMGVLEGDESKIEQLVKEGKYEKVSVVWAPKVTLEDGTQLKHVIAQVALLGAEFPGMWDQPDSLAIEGAVAHSASASPLTTFTVAPGVVVEGVTVFSEEREHEAGGNDKTIEEKYAALLERVGKIEAAATAQTEAVKKFLEATGTADLPAALKVHEKMTADMAAKDTTIADMKTEDEKREKASAEASIKAGVDAAVAGERMLPTERESATTFAMGLDRTAVVKFTAADGKETEGSSLDQYLNSLATRAKVIKYSGISSDEGAGNEGAAVGDAVSATSEGGGGDEVPTPSAVEAKVWSSLGVTAEQVHKFSGLDGPGKGVFPGQPVKPVKTD